MFHSHPDANIAILPDLCVPRLAVVDCDDHQAFAIAEARYGHSPLVVATPRGNGCHLYYRAPRSALRQRNLRRSEGIAVDIKAGPGAVVIVPPSVRPSTGRRYTFARGGWNELSSLPVFREPPCTALPRLPPSASSTARVGERNDHLFRKLLRYALQCETIGELETIAHAVNETACVPPLPWDEVIKIAASAWRYEQTDDNWVGRGRRTSLLESEVGLLADEPYALMLLTTLRLFHKGVREQFCVSPRAMASAKVLPGWSAYAYRRAVCILEERGLLLRVHFGGRGQGDPHLFSFADALASKGAKSVPNTNKTPSPQHGAPTSWPASRRRAA